MAGGNLRELHNTIERAVILCEGDTIDLTHLPCELRERTLPSNTFQPSVFDLQKVSLKKYVDQIERSLVVQALQLSEGNQIKAAEILGEPRHIVRYFIKKHGLKDALS